MKKLFTVLLTALMVFACTATVFAEGKTDPTTTTTDVTYTVAESFTWSIPANITLTTKDAAEGGEVGFTAGGLCTAGDTYKITYKAANGNLVSTTDSNVKLEYKVVIGTTDSVPATTATDVLEATAADINTGKKVAFKAKFTQAATQAGVYKDTVTFECAKKTS